MQHQSNNVGDPSQGPTNLEADHHRRNFYLEFEANRCADFEEKRKKRKERELRPQAKLPTGTTCLHCGRKLMAKLAKLASLAIFVLTEQNTTTILNTEGSPTQGHSPSGRPEMRTLVLLIEDCSAIKPENILLKR